MITRNQAIQLTKVVLRNLLPVVLAFIPIISDMRLHERGPEPEKHVGILQRSFNQPLIDLGRLSSSSEVAISIGNRRFTNLYITNVDLSNNGSSPILPADFHEPLSVSVESPWEIVTVENGRDTAQQISLKWESITPQKFAAVRSLMNPGDSITAVVYLTNPTLPPLSVIEGPKQPSLLWNARITNMKSFEPATDRIRKMWEIVFDTFGSGIYSILSGKKLVFTFLFGSANMLLLSHLLINTKIIRRLSFRSTLIVTGVATFSAVVGECLATYACGDVVTAIIEAVESLRGMVPSGHGWANAIPVILNSLLILVLLNWNSIRKLHPQEKRCQA